MTSLPGALHDALLESLASRPAATVVTSRPGAVEETYAAVVSALGETGPADGATPAVR